MPHEPEKILVLEGLELVGAEGVPEVVGRPGPGAGDFQGLERPAEGLDDPVIGDRRAAVD